MKETNEVFDNQFLSEMSWAECAFSIIVSCSVAVHRGFFFSSGSADFIFILRKINLHLNAGNENCSYLDCSLDNWHYFILRDFTCKHCHVSMEGNLLKENLKGRKAQAIGT